MNDNKIEANLLPRLLAYLIDFFIILFATSFIFSMFPQYDKYVELNNDLSTIVNSFLKQEISNNDYISKTNELTYEMAKSSVINDVVFVTFVILYFVLYQKNNQGQTIGKRLLKIRVISLDSDLTNNQLMIRGVVLYTVYGKLINLATLLFTNKLIFISVSYMISFINFIVMTIIIFMVIFRKDKRGLHDTISKTKVVTTKEKELEICAN